MCAFHLHITLIPFHLLAAAFTASYTQTLFNRLPRKRHDYARKTRAINDVP
jgi:hypothetical protein